MKRALKFAGRYVVAAAGCIYLLTVGWLRRAHRATLHEIPLQLGWRKRPAPASSGPSLEIPQIRARDWLPNPPPVLVLEQDAADGNVTGYELLLIAQLVAACRAERVFEIGTFDGRTTLNLAANIPAEGRVYTLDLPPQEMNQTGLKIASGDEKFIQKERSGARFVGTAYAHKIEQLYGDSALFDFSPFEGQMDVVFVDGSHSYDYVKSDTRVALRLLKPSGGLILWHDYGSRWWKDLTRAMNELRRERPELAGMRHIAGTALVAWRR